MRPARRAVAQQIADRAKALPCPYQVAETWWRKWHKDEAFDYRTVQRVAVTIAQRREAAWTPEDDPGRLWDAYQLKELHMAPPVAATFDTRDLDRDRIFTRQAA